MDQHSIEKIIEGYDRHLDLIFNFWNGLHSRIAELSAKSTAAA